jgi:RNA polymerase sigma-70 factor (ECF subfamily)
MAEDVTKLSAEGEPGPREISAEDYHRLQPKLVAILRDQGASIEQAREMIQETFLRAHRNLETFEGRSAFDTWVVSVAKLTWLQHQRDQRRLKRNADETALDAVSLEIPDAAQNPEKQVIARDQLDRIRRAIQRLPEAMQQAFRLHLAGHKYRQIAGLMGIPESRVTSLIHQARQKLRREAAGQPADSPL